MDLYPDFDDFDFNDYFDDFNEPEIIANTVCDLSPDFEDFEPEISSTAECADNFKSHKIKLNYFHILPKEITIFILSFLDVVALINFETAYDAEFNIKKNNPFAGLWDTVTALKIVENARFTKFSLNHHIRLNPRITSLCAAERSQIIPYLHDWSINNSEPIPHIIFLQCLRKIWARCLNIHHLQILSHSRTVVDFYNNLFSRLKLWQEQKYRQLLTVKINIGIFESFSSSHFKTSTNQRQMVIKLLDFLKIGRPSPRRCERDSALQKLVLKFNLEGAFVSPLPWPEGASNGIISHCPNLKIFKLTGNILSLSHPANFAPIQTNQNWPMEANIATPDFQYILQNAPKFTKISFPCWPGRLLTFPMQLIALFLQGIIYLAEVLPGFPLQLPNFVIFAEVTHLHVCPSHIEHIMRRLGAAHSFKFLLLFPKLSFITTSVNPTLPLLHYDLANSLGYLIFDILLFTAHINQQHFQILCNKNSYPIIRPNKVEIKFLYHIKTSTYNLLEIVTLDRINTQLEDSFRSLLRKVRILTHDNCLYHFHPINFAHITPRCNQLRDFLQFEDTEQQVTVNCHLKAKFE